jgi:hypothetical protein
MNGGELFLGGMAAFALLAIMVKARGGVRRAAQRPTSPESGPARCR